MRTTIVAALAATLLSPLAMAQNDQRPRRPQRSVERSPEDAARIWTAHAAATANQLDLTGEQTSQLVKAYVAARESLRTAHREAMREMRQGQGGETDGNQAGERPRRNRGERAERGERRDRGDFGRRGQRGGPDREAMEKVTDAERAKLKSTLATFMNDAQLDRAMASIGQLNRRADRVIGTVLALELDAAKTDQALNAVLGFMAAMPNRADMAELDREGMRAAMMDAREIFMTEMESILTEDELATFRETMRPRRGGPRDGAGRAGRGGPGGRGPRGDRDFELPPL